VRRARVGRAFMQCASCRFSALYFMPFCGGLAAAGRLSPRAAILGAVGWLTLALAVEVTNRLADRSEDEINRPERTALCARVGWDRMARLQWALWCAVAALALAWLASAPGTLLAGVLCLGAGAGLGYSRGPRFARHRALVFVVLSGTFVGPFVLGWAAGSPGASLPEIVQLGRFTPLFWVMTLFITSLGGIKDLTDRAGDATIGYRSAFLDLLDRHGTAALALVAALPYAALVAFVLAGALPSRTLALLALAPASLALGLAARSTRGDAREQLAVREAFYLHWIAFSAAALLLFEPSAPLLAAVLLSVSAWVLAGRWLHWSEPLRRADVRRVAALARAGLADRPPAVPVSPRHEERAWAAN